MRRLCLEHAGSDESDESNKEEYKKLGSKSGSFGTCGTCLGGLLSGEEFPVGVILAVLDGSFGGDGGGV